MQKIKLFCVPYAGASASVYIKWNKFLNESIELRPLELAGRGARYGKKFYENLGEAVDDLYNLIKDELDEPYAFFGHSVGSWIVYELYHKIKEQGHKLPRMIFFSGNVPPHIGENKVIYNLKEEEFKEEVRKYGGLSEEILENKDIMTIFIPVLRADFKIAETYRYYPKREKLDVPIIILNGESDSLKLSELAEWGKYTKKSCDIYMFKGNHFFINDCLEEVTKVINEKLLVNNNNGYEEIRYDEL